jgi:hypothetical protein
LKFGQRQRDRVSSVPRKLCLLTGVDEDTTASAEPGRRRPAGAGGRGIERHLTVTAPTGRALIRHATSGDHRRDLVMMTTTIDADGQPLEAAMRMISPPPQLLSFQRETAGRALEVESALLLDCGVWR